MTVFVYDNTKIDQFTTFQGGDITVGSSENIDYGDIVDNVEPERDENFFFVNDWGLITATADVLPFGPINVVDGRDALGRSRSQWIPENANTVLFDVNDTALEKAVTPWIGSGTIQEIGSGLERIVIPDLGAAGAVIFIPSGTAEESISRGNYDGAGAIAKSGLSATDLDQVYPYVGSGDITLSGTTTTPYDEAYLPVIKNAFRVKGGDTRLFDVEKVIYNYARSVSDVFEKEDNGTITVREGASFDNLDVTFDEIITDPLGRERSFSDEDQVEFESYGNIVDTPTSTEDYGVIEQQLQGGIFLDEYQATFVKGRDAIVRGYEGSGTFKKEGVADADRFFAYSGSGTATFSGENFFSQAPQSTIFGVGDTITASGSADESFIPAIEVNTVLFDISGTGGQVRSAESAASTALVRLTGSVSGIKLTLGVGARTVLFDVSGAATNIQVAKDYENTNLFNISGEMSQGVPVYTPSWFSPLGDQITEEVDWGKITETPTQSYEDWGVVNTNDETIPKSAENWGFLLPDFNYVQIGGQHYPNRELTFSTGDSSLVVDTGDVTGIATFLLSEDLDIAAAIQYESSGKSGIATHNAGLFFSGELWLSQAQQHTVFGEEGQISILGTGNESITPFIPEGSGSLFKFGGAAESSTKAYLVGDYQYLSGTANVNFAPHVTGVGIVTASTSPQFVNRTYARVIQLPPDEFGGVISLTGQDINEKNTDSYNESSIRRGSENEDYGRVDDRDISQGFGFNQQGAGMPSVESLDDGTITFDNENQSGLTYDEAVSGSDLVPSFDKTNQYNINFSSTVVAEDYGFIGISSGGGRPYTRDYPFDNGFTQQNVNRGFVDYGWVDEVAPQPALFPYGTFTFESGASGIQYTPSFPGSGTLVVSGIGAERVAVASSTTSLFDFVSGAEERYIAQTPEGTVLFDISGIATEKTTRDFVGSGSITLDNGVGIVTYRRVLNEVVTGITTVSGVADVASSFDPPEGTYLHIFGDGYTDLSVGFAAQSSKAVMRLSGELTHPDIDYTPHYGIDRNIGIETGLTILPGGAGGEYGDPGIVTTRFIPKYPGRTPVLKLDGRSISRTNAPITTHGVIYILGIGTAGNGVGGPDEQGDLDGVEFGAKERFIPATEIGAGSLLFDFQTTGAEARPISVFGYYGDDKDPGTSGQITIRQEGGIFTEESIIRIYRTDGAGGYIYSGAAQDESTTFSEVGGGSLFAVGGIAETFTAAELVAGTSIFNGEADVAFSAQTPENTATLTISGETDAFRLREFDGSGTLTLSNDIKVVTGVRNSLVVSGTLFGLGSAAESITIPSAARAILTDITGAAETRYLQVFQDFIPSGTFTISGELTHPDIDFTPAYTGLGVATLSGTALQKFVGTEVASGTVALSGNAILRFAADDLEGTVLFDTKGASALTALNQVYGYYGDDKDPGTSGITTISGVGITKPIQVFGYYGDDRDPGTSGTFTFSNTPLVHPDVRYIPSIGIGVAVLYQTGGTALESFTFANYETQGRFKGLASVKESFGRATYVGIGQINTSGIAQEEYAVFEEPRTYVVII